MLPQLPRLYLDNALRDPFCLETHTLSCVFLQELVSLSPQTPLHFPFYTCVLFCSHIPFPEVRVLNCIHSSISKSNLTLSTVALTRLRFIASPFRQLGTESTYLSKGSPPPAFHCPILGVEVVVVGWAAWFRGW